MTQELIFVIEEAPEGGFVAKALGHSIYTEADTWEELKAAVQDAVTCHFDEEMRPGMVRLHVVRDEMMLV
ncbi:MAG: 2-oxoisovalerate dehydrogenase [Anaerolineae bacterium]